MNRLQPLIVGAGPAGIRAAATLVQAGLRPVVVDEAKAAGGQIYRRPWLDDGRSAAALYGSEAPKATRLHAEFAALAGQVDYWPQSLVWNLRAGQADVVQEGRHRQCAFDGVLLATGATDRVLPLPGWTLPGVFTLGGAQIALKTQGCAIGRRTVFVGSGPLLYLVAWQYLRAGAEVAAVLDTAPLTAKAHLLRGLARDARVVLRGARYAAELRLRGVPLHFGVQQVQFEGTDRMTGVRWSKGAVACDAAGYGLGLRSENQLADLLGCQFVFDRRDRAWRVQRDDSGRSSVAGVYVAGDGAAIAGADAAELAGELAALTLLADRGLPVDAARKSHLQRRLAAIARMRDVLEAAFPFPAHWVDAIADSTAVCRCEEVSAGDVREAVQRFGVTELNRLKAVSRIGMGRCQGRMCAAGAAEMLAAATGQPIGAVGRLRGQAPVKPLPMGLGVADEESAA
jgi:NADPH-dependent 2,4-dienoyl-CoA reductase/sulfur reductase-like enzyme